MLSGEGSSSTLSSLKISKSTFDNHLMTCTKWELDELRPDHALSALYIRRHLNISRTGTLGIWLLLTLFTKSAKLKDRYWLDYIHIFVLTDCPKQPTSKEINCVEHKYMNIPSPSLYQAFCALDFHTSVKNR